MTTLFSGWGGPGKGGSRHQSSGNGIESGEREFQEEHLQLLPTLPRETPGVPLLTMSTPKA